MTNDDIIKWDERYTVDIPILDDQHRTFIKMTNDLYEGCLRGGDTAKQYLLEAVQEAAEYAKTHFVVEEQILEKIQYPKFADHKKEHEAFIRQVLQQVKEFEAGHTVVPHTYAKYLKEWLLTHIAISDKQYSLYIKSLKRQNILESLI
ncbi:MAG: bacteriohemerythrin [Treponema sp.]|jgi:hemerythrin|nr:bacteriohemerythrin [Treponema sp.]